MASPNRACKSYPRLKAIPFCLTEMTGILMRFPMMLALALLNGCAGARAQNNMPSAAMQAPGQTTVQVPAQVPAQKTAQKPAQPPVPAPAQPPAASPAQPDAPGAAQVPGQLPAQTPGQTPGQAAGQAAAPDATAPAAQTPTQPGAPAAKPAVGVSANYVLGADDAILVTVYKDPTLSGALVVRPDGKITLPLLDDVQAAGLTPMALADDLKERLKKFIVDPAVSVTVTGVNSKHIFFIGEVNKTGPQALDTDMTVLQAISAAGGLTPYAKASHIYILRGPAGKQQKIAFDYKKALKTGNQQGVTLMAGDTIVVP